MRNWSSVIGNWSLRKQGFSLVELIFAVILLTVIVFGVVKLQTSTLALGNTQNNEVEAYFLANQGAEIVKGLGKAVILTQCPSVSCTCKLTESGDYSLDCSSGNEDLGLFKRTVEIDSTGLVAAYKVTAIVEWEDSTGKHFKADTDGDGQPDNAHVEAKRIIF